MCQNENKVFLDVFSVHSARNDVILGQDARSRLYLSLLRAFVLKCRFDIDFGCWKVDSDGPKMAYLSTLRKSEIVFFDDFSVGTAQDDFILSQVATNRLYLSWVTEIVLKYCFEAVFGCLRVDSDGPRALWACGKMGQKFGFRSFGQILHMIPLSYRIFRVDYECSIDFCI